MNRILIVELNKYHSEVFPIYQEFLPCCVSGKLEFHYACHNDQLKEISNQYKNTHSVANNLQYFIIRNLQLRIPFFKNRIQKLIDNLGIDIVVFNSVEPNRYFEVFRKINANRKIAILHNPLRFPIERREDEHFFALSKTVYEHVRNKIDLSGYFLPFIKPHNALLENNTTSRILVGIQGLVDYRRRDYQFLIELSREIKAKKFKEVVFNIIGSNNRKGGVKIREEIKHHGLEEYFILHERLNAEAFYSELEKCNLLMPLLGPKQQRYLKHKTTATLSHAAAFGKPMLLSRTAAETWQLDESTQYIFDNKDTCLNQLFNLTDLSQKTENFKSWVQDEIEENKRFLSQNCRLESP